jgi:hypothetical protein
MRITRKRLSPVVLALIAGVLSAPYLAHAYSLTTWSWNEPIALKLTDGREIHGRYRGVFGRTSNPDTYPARYAEWRTNLGSAAVPALGETLLVKRAAGDPVRGALQGFAEDALMLGVADSCICLVLPLKEITGVEPALERGTEPAAFAPLRRWKSAPSAYAVGLEVGGTLIAVPVSMVESRAMLPRGGANQTATVITGVLVVAFLLAGAAIAAAASAVSHPLI